jgi:hypothetical protein
MTTDAAGAPAPCAANAVEQADQRGPAKSPPKRRPVPNRPVSRTQAPSGHESGAPTDQGIPLCLFPLADSRPFARKLVEANGSLTKESSRRMRAYGIAVARANPSIQSTADPIKGRSRGRGSNPYPDGSGVRYDRGAPTLPFSPPAEPALEARGRQNPQGCNPCDSASATLFTSPRWFPAMAATWAHSRTW